MVVDRRENIISNTMYAFRDTTSNVLNDAFEYVVAEYKIGQCTYYQILCPEFVA